MKGVDCSMRSLAKQAKDRLCHESLREELEHYLRTCTALQDEIMHDKICEMQASGKTICNPLDRLLDKTKFREYEDEAARQKMVLDVSKKYIKMKRKIYNESNHNRG